MNSKKLLILLCLLIISFIYANDSAGQQLISIVPQPVRLERSEGEFILRPNTEISVNKDTMELGRQLAAKLQPATGFYLNVHLC